MNKHQAIYATHPDVKVIRGDEAFDAAGNPVQYSEVAVQAYMDANAYKEKRAAAYQTNLTCCTTAAWTLGRQQSQR